MNDYVKRKDVINITAETGAIETQRLVKELPGNSLTESILGKAVKEAMSNIVSLYEEHSGTITVYDSDNSESLTLAFKEGNGYLISDSPLMDKVVFKFSISGIGYYIFIELWADEANVSYNASVKSEAEWSYRDDYGNPVPCHCTNCGCRAHTETGNAGCQTITEDILSNFCPNCGARMIKEESING